MDLCLPDAAFEDSGSHDGRLSAERCLAALQLKELKQELGALRVAKVTGGAPNKLSKMWVCFATCAVYC